MTVEHRRKTKKGTKKAYHYEQYLLPSDSPEAEYIKEQSAKLGIKPTKWLERAVRKMMKK